MSAQVHEQDENEIISIRKQKLAELRKHGFIYPNTFRRNHLAANLTKHYGETGAEDLLAQEKRVAVAGRIMLRRVMGKASFVHIQDMSGRIQLYLRKDNLPENVYDDFKTWDLGDIIGVEGVLFKTKTGELTVNADKLYLLSKSLRPLPDKFHGLADRELRYRQRYIDLAVNESTRNMFLIRSQLIGYLRQFLCEREFLEVETPMMQPIPGGAIARPFITHHNTLDMDLYLRISPELYLKRLVVGGFERVFEINRNFRNEGLSTQHNPEFTMLEFYQSYADYHDLIALTEEMMRYLARQVLGTAIITYQGQQIDFEKAFACMTVQEAILHYNQDITAENLKELAQIRKIARRLDIAVQDSYGVGKIQIEIFEKTVEAKLQQPTFITAYPTEVSPLARRNNDDPSVTDRFELFIAGREIANGFSELNDPEDQAERFKQQAANRSGGDLEAMYYDADYIAALEYGLPPAAGEGIGVDRLVMLFTDAASIRDVILFPHMRQQS